MARLPSAYLCVVLCLLSAPLPVDAASSSRPFWTEKTSYVEGEDLFVVGIATKSRTPEEGRQQAFERGKVELMNFLYKGSDTLNHPSTPKEATHENEA